MSEKPKIFRIGDNPSGDFAERLDESFDVESVGEPIRILDENLDLNAAGILIDPNRLEDSVLKSKVLDELPVGVGLVDEQVQILWANKCLIDWFDGDLIGCRFGHVFQSDEPSAQQHCPIRATLETGQSSTYTITAKDGRSFRISCTPIEPTKNKARAYRMCAQRDQRDHAATKALCYSQSGNGIGRPHGRRSFSDGSGRANRVAQIEYPPL